MLFPGDLNHPTIRGGETQLFSIICSKAGGKKFSQNTSHQKPQQQIFTGKFCTTLFEMGKNTYVQLLTLSTADSYCLLLLHRVAGDFLGKMVIINSS